MSRKSFIDGKKLLTAKLAKQGRGGRERERDRFRGLVD
jgi:hypothetical protein